MRKKLKKIIVFHKISINTYTKMGFITAFCTDENSIVFTQKLISITHYKTDNYIRLRISILNSKLTQKEYFQNQLICRSNKKYAKILRKSYNLLDFSILTV